MNVWGEDKVKDLEKYQVGDKVRISFNLSSREFNGRWYTDVRAWRIEPAGAPAAPAAPVAPAVSVEAPLPGADDMSSPFSDEDLPF